MEAEFEFEFESGAERRREGKKGGSAEGSGRQQTALEHSSERMGTHLDVLHARHWPLVMIPASAQAAAGPKCMRARR